MPTIGRHKDGWARVQRSVKGQRALWHVTMICTNMVEVNMGEFLLITAIIVAKIYYGPAVCQQLRITFMLMELLGYASPFTVWSYLIWFRKAIMLIRLPSNTRSCGQPSHLQKWNHRLFDVLALKQTFHWLLKWLLSNPPVDLLWIIVLHSWTLLRLINAPDVWDAAEGGRSLFRGYTKKKWFAALNLMQSVSLVQLSSSPLVGINSRAVLSPEPSRHQVFPATTNRLWEIALKIVFTLISLDVLHYRRLPRVSSVERKTKKSFQIHTGLFRARAEQKALITFIETSRLEWSWCSTPMSERIHSIRFLICLFWL